MEPVVRNRKHLTPAPGLPDVGTHALRRGGARRGVTERVILRRDELSYEGWALNVSRGGVRAICEERITLGADFDVTIGEEAGLTRRGRIVWVQEEPDGVIIGIEFLGASQTFKSAPPVAPEGAEVHSPSVNREGAGEKSNEPLAEAKKDG